MATWKILGQDATTSTGRSVVYTASTGGAVAWALIHNRSTSSIVVDVFVSTSTGVPVKSQIYGFAVPAKDTLGTERFTMSSGDSVIWDQVSTGISISVFGSESIT